MDEGHQHQEHRRLLFSTGRMELTGPPGSGYRVSCGFEDADTTQTRERSGDQKNRGRRSSHRFQHQEELKELMGLYKGLQGPGDDAVLQYFDVTVYRSDLQNLRCDEWLNDNNISFVYEYLERSYLADGPAAQSWVLLRPSMAYLLMQTPDARSLKPVLPNLEKAQLVFMPINDNQDVTMIEGGCHWSLLVACPPAKRVFYYDSLSGANFRPSIRATTQLSLMMGIEYKFVDMATPQQSNSSDCGVLVCEITALLLHRLLQAGAEDDVALDVDSVNLVASAGRTFILKTILELIQKRSM